MSHLFNFGRRESSEAKKAKTRNVKPHLERECDLYANPTELSRCIISQKYSAAIRRLKRQPDEISIWVTRQRDRGSTPNTSNMREGNRSAASSISGSQSSAASPNGTMSAIQNKYSYRQLPLHMACNNLGLVERETNPGKHLEQLLSHLIVTYPAACGKRNHMNKLPLHEALANGASPDTIQLLLIAYPEAAEEPDPEGRTALEINHDRPGASQMERETIHRMLTRNKDFYKSAKQEADLRLKHRKVPSVSRSVCSTSVLDDSDGELTLGTRENASRPGQVSPETAAMPRVVSREEELEHRVMELEQALEQSNEQNLHMVQEVSRLEEIQQRYYKLTAKNFLAKQVVQLEEDNAELKMQLNLLNNVMDSSEMSLEDASVFSGPRTVRVEQTGTNINTQRLQDENDLLRAQVASLTVRLKEFQSMLEQYEETSHRSSNHEDDPSVVMSTTSTAEITHSNPAAREELPVAKSLPMTTETQTSVVQEDETTPQPEAEFAAVHTATTETPIRLTEVQNIEGMYQAEEIPPPSVSPLQQGTMYSLDGLLELAEQRYGYSFSPELVSAWRNITVDGDNISLFGDGGFSVVEEMIRYDEESMVGTFRTETGEITEFPADTAEA